MGKHVLLSYFVCFWVGNKQPASKAFLGGFTVVENYNHLCFFGFKEILSSPHKLLPIDYVIMLILLRKGSFQKRFSGIRPLMGGGVPPFSAKEKNLLFFTLIFR